MNKLTKVIESLEALNNMNVEIDEKDVESIDKFINEFRIKYGRKDIPSPIMSNYEQGMQPILKAANNYLNLISESKLRCIETEMKLQIEDQGDVILYCVMTYLYGEDIFDWINGKLD